MNRIKYEVIATIIRVKERCDQQKRYSGNDYIRVCTCTNILWFSGEITKDQMYLIKNYFKRRYYRDEF